MRCEEKTRHAVYTCSAVLQRKNAVTAYMESDQLLLFAFALPSGLQYLNRAMFHLNNRVSNNNLVIFPVSRQFVAATLWSVYFLTINQPRCVL